ncbi:MAG TPA: zinc ABC transporter substrate-binding protein [Steroidobacteraceae bacterium]|nr:zinc ABC transporter substrate-binding protein [Steroidobacteraceae bacterium]
MNRMSLKGLLRATLVAVAGLASAPPVQAAVKVLATTADWAALTTELGGEKVDVYRATTALQDVHTVEAKPSLVARARTADLLVATGAELELGWLPVLLQESGNRRIQPGAPGYFEAAAAVKLVDVPTQLDRSMGDIHAEGNPHIQLDPRNIAAVAQALTTRLAAVDAPNAAYYQARGADFQRRWAAALQKWTAQAAPLRGTPVVVIHRDQRYLASWLGLDEVAAIEPKPGVPPSAGYLASLVQRLGAKPPKLILRNAYNDPKAADWLAARISVPVVVLPFSVGGTPEAKDLFALFDDTLRRLLAAAGQGGAR